MYIVIIIKKYKDAMATIYNLYNLYMVSLENVLLLIFFFIVKVIYTPLITVNELIMSFTNNIFIERNDLF